MSGSCGGKRQFKQPWIYLVCLPCSRSETCLPWEILLLCPLGGRYSEHLVQHPHTYYQQIVPVPFMFLSTLECNPLRSVSLLFVLGEYISNKVFLRILKCILYFKVWWMGKGWQDNLAIGQRWTKEKTEEES